MATSMGGPTAYTLTLTGSIQRLSSLLPDGTVESSLKLLSLQAAAGNAAAAYLGGPAVSSSDYGVYIPKPVTSLPAAPIQLYADEAQLCLSDLYVIGTANDKLQILIIPTNPVR